MPAAARPPVSCSCVWGCSHGTRSLPVGVSLSPGDVSHCASAPANTSRMRANPAYALSASIDWTTTPSQICASFAVNIRFVICYAMTIEPGCSLSTDGCRSCRLRRPRFTSTLFTHTAAPAILPLPCDQIRRQRSFAWAVSAVLHPSAMGGTRRRRNATSKADEPMAHRSTLCPPTAHSVDDFSWLASTRFLFRTPLAPRASA